MDDYRVVLEDLAGARYTLEVTAAGPRAAEHKARVKLCIEHPQAALVARTLRVELVPEI